MFQKIYDRLARQWHSREIYWVRRSQFSLRNETAPVRDDIRCDLIDGCYNSSYIWVSHRRQAIYFETPKAASRSIRRAMGIRSPYFWPNDKSCCRPWSLSGKSYNLLVDRYGRQIANTIIRNLVYCGIKKGNKHRVIDPSASELSEPIQRLLQTGTMRMACYNERRGDLWGFELFYGTPQEVDHKFPGYFTFSAVRDPWSRMVSIYKMYFHKNKRRQMTALMGNTEERKSFPEFLKLAVANRNHHWEQYVRYLPVSEIGKIRIDEIIHLDKFQEGWKRVETFLGGPIPIKTLNRTSHSYYRSFYPGESCEIVAKEFDEDIRVFDFSF